MSKEFRIGLIALVSGAILYYGFNFLKGIELFSDNAKYFVLYDNVDGLSKSDLITPAVEEPPHEDPEDPMA